MLEFNRFNSLISPVMAWNHKDSFEFILELVLAQCSNLAPFGANLTGSILDLSVMVWNRRDFFEFLNRFLPDAEI